MISKITGLLAALHEERAVIAAMPFEYEVLIPEYTRRQLQGEVGKTVSLHTIYSLDGNPQGKMTPRLIGFLKEAEREFFDLFCSVDGVGARKALRELIGKNDPWHPAWTLTYRYEDLPYYGISGDIIGVDPYPISEEPNEEKDIKKIKEAMLAGNSTGLPVWVVPQIFNWGSYKLRNEPEKFAQSHFPTAEEMRAMPLYAAMLGAKGFIFYSNFDICQKYEQILPKSGVAEREWAKFTQSIKPLQKLEPFIMSTQKPLPIAVQSEPQDTVEAGALLDDNGNYKIIVIGTGGKAKGTFTLPEKLRRAKNELHSLFGKTKPLGEGKYEFTCEAVDSDILE